MKTLIINGSPKGSHSNTLRLSQAFVKDINTEVTEIHLKEKHISHCLGCFSCWKVTPGKCCINDDMKELLELIKEADMIIYSFPLYYYNVPGLLKDFIDRQLPFVLPFMEEREDNNGSGSHHLRIDMSHKKYVLISTCGFYSAKGNYNSVLSMFDHICGKDNYETIFCGQGELFRVPELHNRTDAYLEVVSTAGQEYMHGSITKETRDKLNTLLFPKETFETMADASWGIEKETGEKEEDSLIFTKQMMALYHPGSYDGLLQMRYTDIHKTYTFKLDDTSTYIKDNTHYDVCIETPYSVWLDIASGKIHGDEALMKGLYKVLGDFDFMVNWNQHFGEEVNETFDKKPKMWVCLLPWTVLWIVLSINPLYALILCGCMIGFELFIPFTIYDYLSILCVTLLSTLSLLTTLPIRPISYLLFGLLWFISSFLKEPLCAAYVKYNYGGERALKNPMFVKTNQILAFLWGLLYIILGLLKFFIPLSDIVIYIGTAVMGLFTVWFEGWYPAYIARR